MRDGGRLGAAIEVLTEIEARRRPVADALKEWGLAHRFAGSGDRIAIGNLVYDVLRCRASLAYRAGQNEPRALALAAYAVLWGQGLDGLDRALADPHAPGALSADERAALSRANPLADAPLAVRADVPDWLATSFERVFGDHAEAEGRALAERAPIDLRVNTLKSSRAAMLDELSHLKASATKLAPHAVRVPVGAGPAKPPHVQSEPAYKRGLVEIQDEGSQIASALANAKSGELVLDLCAGAGGKTLAMAADMQNKGTIHVYDADKRRFGDLFERLERAAVRLVDVRHPERPDPLGALEGRMDLVLVDAPCTGTGTWRRRPDAKWRVTPNALAGRTREQDEVLAKAARMVRPGGRVVYITCSVLPEENEDRIAAFLSLQGDFALETPGPGSSVETAIKAFVRMAPGLGPVARLTPLSAGTDGFFVACLRKRG